MPRVRAELRWPNDCPCLSRRDRGRVASWDCKLRYLGRSCLTSAGAVSVGNVHARRDGASNRSILYQRLPVRCIWRAPCARHPRDGKRRWTDWRELAMDFYHRGSIRAFVHCVTDSAD